MTDNDRKEAIKEVLKWVKSGKQDLQNGAEEIDTINYIYEQDKVKKLNIDDVSNQRKLLIDFMHDYNKENEGTGNDWIDIEDIDQFLESNL